MGNVLSKLTCTFSLMQIGFFKLRDRLCGRVTKGNFKLSSELPQNITVTPL